MELRPFKNWKFDDHSVKSPDGKHVLWTGSTFSFGYFTDWKPEKIMIRGLTRREKKRIWNDLEKEIRFRSLESVAEFYRQAEKEIGEKP